MFIFNNWKKTRMRSNFLIPNHKRNSKTITKLSLWIKPIKQLRFLAAPIDINKKPISKSP